MFLKAINQIKLAISNKEISQEEVDNRCRKILNYKYWMGLSEFSPINLDKVKNEVTINNTHYINRKLIENSITLVQNYDNLLPLKRLDTLNIASVCIGESGSYFQSTLSKYAKIDHFNISENDSEKQQEELLSKLSKYNLVLIGIHKSNDNPWKSYKFSKDCDLLVQKIAIQSKVVVSVFANPYSLNSFLFINNFDAIVLSYQNSEISQEMSAQAIFLEEFQ